MANKVNVDVNPFDLRLQASPPTLQQEVASSEDLPPIGWNTEGIQKWTLRELRFGEPPGVYQQGNKLIAAYNNCGFAVTRWLQVEGELTLLLQNPPLAFADIPAYEEKYQKLLEERQTSIKEVLQTAPLLARETTESAANQYYKMAKKEVKDTQGERTWYREKNKVKEIRDHQKQLRPMAGSGESGLEGIFNGQRSEPTRLTIYQRNLNLQSSL
jgi:hypothetical protein